MIIVNAEKFIQAVHMLHHSVSGKITSIEVDEKTYYLLVHALHQYCSQKLPISSDLRMNKVTLFGIEIKKQGAHQ